MEVVIFIGLQAAGKTTFYQTHFASTHVLVSKDRLRHNRRPSRRQEQLIRTALASGQSVVADNTNPTVADRAALIALARAYDATVVGYYFEPEVKHSLERNRARTGNARVPDVAIFATVKRLEPPSLDEGFDRLYRVRATSNGGFEVHDVVCHD